MKRDGFPSPIGEVLKKVLNKFSLERKIKETRALSLWKEVVGERINKHTRPFSVRGRNLFVWVDSSAWMAQLTYLKENIISELNQRQGEEVIKDIYFRLGSFKEDKVEEIKFTQKRIKLEKEEREKIRKDLERVKDKSLRLVLRRILIKDRKLKKIS